MVQSPPDEPVSARPRPHPPIRRRRPGHRAAGRPAARLAGARAARRRPGRGPAHLRADRPAGRPARLGLARIAVAGGRRAAGDRGAVRDLLAPRRRRHGHPEHHQRDCRPGHLRARRRGGPGLPRARGRHGRAGGPAAGPQGSAAPRAAAHAGGRTQCGAAAGRAQRGHPAAAAQRGLRSVRRHQSLPALAGGDLHRGAVAARACDQPLARSAAGAAVDRRAGRTGLVHRRDPGAVAIGAGQAGSRTVGGGGRGGRQRDDVHPHGRGRLAAAGRPRPAPGARCW